MASSATKKSVLFVCYEGVFRDMVSQRADKDEWKIDSAGISDWHEGEYPDERTSATLESKIGHRLDHIGRQITEDDYNKFHYIFGFDESNISDINSMKPAGCEAVIQLLGEFDPQKQRVIADSYYGDMSVFQRVYNQCRRCLTAFLEKEFS
ncbi:low molecular weight phosphotyrosine protein phosphatase-like isoform X2 [Amphiura filiformis]|uniref:low molecular weight phosphotyrosine protein phosphatase-like isoform X2 n=1 Tax=Amphiura filiformis TaxID=82378 RepID=UPI003B224F50